MAKHIMKFVKVLGICEGFHYEEQVIRLSNKTNIRFWLATCGEKTNLCQTQCLSANKNAVV